MANANTSINIGELDFDQIKSNLKTYLKSKNTFNDFDFEASNISTILDILAYNTHYNAYYLNLVANEMFLDTALKRSSVISHAKLLNYTPYSVSSSKALVNITFNGIQTPTFTIPKYTRFYSEALDNINYPFVNLQSAVVTTVNNIAQFNDIELYQGQAVRYTFNVDTVQNPKLTFKIPDTNVDVSTISVHVFDTAQSSTFKIYTLNNNTLQLDSTSQVFFLQEGLDGNYEIYFGDGILGKTLISQNVVVVEYLTTKASIPNGVSKFTLVDDIGSFTSIKITATQSAIGGKEKESINSIKFTAPKVYSAQNRAVSKEDFIQLINNKNTEFPIEAINVFGGEELDDPQYGKVFLSIKPKGGYSLSNNQKYTILNDIIKPFAIVTTIPEFIDPEYTYIKLKVDGLYNKNISIYDIGQMGTIIKYTVYNFISSTLNTFNSVFSLTDLTQQIKNADQSIITADTSVVLEKRIFPKLNVKNSFTIKYNLPVEKGTLYSSFFDYLDPITGNVIPNVQIEETPTSLSYINTITVSSSGNGYTDTPTITILGDGKNATATATVYNGKITAINVTNKGYGYTQAVIQISDAQGSGAIAYVNFSNTIVPLRSYYYNNSIKTIVQDDVGSIEYSTGIVKLKDILPNYINNTTGYLSIVVKPTSAIFYSEKNTIITMDIQDSSSMVINLTSR